jgi:hypothetical protein
MMEESETWNDFLIRVEERKNNALSFQDQDFNIYLDRIFPEDTLLKRLSKGMDKESFIDLVKALEEQYEYEEMKNRFFKEGAHFKPEMFQIFRDNMSDLGSILAVNRTVNNRELILNGNFQSLMELSLHC